MKAIAVFPKARKIKVVDHEEPGRPAPTEVKVRMLETGVCGTDKEIAAFEYGTPPAGAEYLVLGHEGFGQVVEVGSEVATLTPGDFVVPMVRRPCALEACRPCQSGSQDFCSTGAFRERGIKEAHGFMTELVVEEERFLKPVPPELRELGVLIEPLTIAEKALRQCAKLQDRLPWLSPNDPMQKGSALVLGAGAVGLLGAMLLRRLGFETCVYSREPAGGNKAKIVEACGARYISAQDASVADIPERVGDVDLVYEACGASALAFRTLDILAPNAVFVFTGVPGRKAPVEIDTAQFMRNLVLKNQLLFGTVNAGHFAFDAAVRDLGHFVESWPEAIGSIVTGRYPMEAHADLLQGKAGGIKNVITLADPSSA